MSAENPGRVRVALAARIKKDLGLDVQPGFIWSQEGGNRNGGGARWGVAGHGLTTSRLHSFDTMTECAKNGVTQMDRYGEVSAKESGA